MPPHSPCAAQGAGGSAAGHWECKGGHSLEAGAASRTSASLEVSGELLFGSEYGANIDDDGSAVDSCSSQRWPSSVDDDAAMDDGSAGEPSEAVSSPR